MGIQLLSALPLYRAKPGRLTIVGAWRLLIVPVEA